jgi:hypothetical protein
MKSKKIWIGLLVATVLFYIFLTKSQEGYKNIDYDAQNQLEKIVTKVLPENAICIRGAQCVSGRCLENNNETTYGYCAKPM